jgi:hypothetical protein
METQHSPLSLTARESFLPANPHPIKEQELPDFPLRGGKLKPVTLQVAPEALFPQDTQKPSTSHCTSLEKSHISLAQELESQLLHQMAIHYSAGARRPTPHSAQRPSSPYCDCRRAPAPLSRAGTPAPSLRGEKRQLAPQQEPCKG